MSVLEGLRQGTIPVGGGVLRAGPAMLALLASAAVGLYVILVQVLQVVGSYGPWAGAWNLTGSILATYGMVQGWVESWLVWILVDVVGVTTPVQAGFYPTAVRYAVNGLFCVWGFAAWVGARRRLADAAHEPTGVEVTA